MLDIIQENRIYSLSLLDHVMGLRRIMGTTIWELFEPNFGIVLFPNKKAFAEWLCGFLCYFYFEKNNIRLRKIGDNKPNANNIYADIMASKKENIEPSIIHKLCQ